jgi:predicted transcriptional regulator
MSEEDDQLAISDKVEILSTDDEKLKAIGEILSSDPSRKILKLLFNQALTANQISQKIEVSLPLAIYHLKKMQESGVIKITKVGQNTKSHNMKFYTVDKFAIVILPT